jgi:hypothetical protein
MILWVFVECSVLQYSIKEDLKTLNVIMSSGHCGLSVDDSSRNPFYRF